MLKLTVPSWLLTLCIIAALSSCGDGNGDQNSKVVNPSDSLVRYGVSNYVFPKLSPQAEDVLSQWPIFEDFQREMSGLNNNTVLTMREATQRLRQHADSLTKSVPDSLFNNAIYSRLIVVNTRANLLNQVLNLSVVDSVALETSLSEMNDAVANLVFQINGKFQKDAIDLQRKEDEEKELEKQKQFLDSVRQAELQDQPGRRGVTN